MTMHGWWWLLLLVAALAGCGDDTSGNPDDGGGADVDDVEASADGLDAPDAHEDGAGTPCEMDFDCAEGAACRDGLCVGTSPAGWCPRLFDRPFRRRPIDTLASGAGTFCGPRCLVLWGVAASDPATEVVLVRRRGDAGVVDTSYAFVWPSLACQGMIAATDDRAGGVIIASYVHYSDYRREFNPRLVVDRLADGVVTNLATVPAADLGVPPGRAEGPQVALARFQWTPEGTLRLVLTFDAQCFAVLVRSGETFSVTSAFCLPDRPDEAAHGIDAAFRGDGGMDVVASYAIDDPTLTHLARAFWLDGLNPTAAAPRAVASGVLPSLCLAPDGGTMLAALRLPDPETELLGAVDLHSLAPGGTIADSWSHDLSSIVSVPSYGSHAVLFCDSSHTVSLAGQGGGGGATALALWRDGTLIAANDLVEAVDGAGGGFIFDNLSWLPDIPRFSWYEACGGFRAVLSERGVDEWKAVSYVEW